MKIILSHAIPFSLAHGGTQTVIEALYHHLPGHGCEVEYERWWDPCQTADLIHYFGRPIDMVCELAIKKGRRVVITEYLDRTASRSKWVLLGQAAMIRIVQRVLPGFVNRMGWTSLMTAHGLVYAVKSEVETAHFLFGADPLRCHVVPHGLDRVALDSLAVDATPGGYLISVGTIDRRKNTLVLARAAKRSGVPVVFVGMPYADDAYYRSFVAEVDGRFVIYKGRVSESEKVELMRRASGFVLLSEYESGCVAVHEAAAARLPMLLARRPWVISSYVSIPGISVVEPDVLATTKALRAFNAKASRLDRMTFAVHSWEDVSGMYRDVYESAFSTSCK